MHCCQNSSNKWSAVSEHNLMLSFLCHSYHIQQLATINLERKVPCLQCMFKSIFTIHILKKKGKTSLA